jgi:hypothetical protein
MKPIEPIFFITNAFIGLLLWKGNRGHLPRTGTCRGHAAGSLTAWNRPASWGRVGAGLYEERDLYRWRDLERVKEGTPLADRDWLGISAGHDQLRAGTGYDLGDARLWLLRSIPRRTPPAGTLMARLPPAVRALEISLLVALGLLLGGVGVVLFGRLAGGAHRGRREREAPPTPGSIPGERHEHTGAVSAR